MDSETNHIVGHELTDQELMTVQGGSLWSVIGSVVSSVGSAISGAVKHVGRTFSTAGRALNMGRLALGFR